MRRLLCLFILPLSLCLFMPERAGAATLPHWVDCISHLDWATATRVVATQCYDVPMPHTRGSVIREAPLRTIRRSPHVVERVYWPVFPAPVIETHPTSETIWLSVSAYAPGCGASGAMASGAMPFVGAAAGTFPFGTRLTVPGFGSVVVKDRGVPSGYLDLFMSSCQAAINFGRQWLPVTVG